MAGQLSKELIAIMTRAADALERQSPPPPELPDFASADAYVWQADPDRLDPVPEVARLAIDLLVGISPVKDRLLRNTRQFADGLPANNALLWGARGMGKSSLVKAVHGTINEERRGALVLIEIHREDIASLPRLMRLLRGQDRRCLILCDDLSFDAHETTYKSLKAALEGGLEGRPRNVLFYATSNRRHLMPRDMLENEQSTAINPSDAAEEKVSLSDRFGLWLGFHKCSQSEYLEMIDRYCAHFELAVADPEQMRHDALEWATTRGARSGRVAWQFIQDLAGRMGRALDVV